MMMYFHSTCGNKVGGSGDHDARGASTEIILEAGRSWGKKNGGKLLVVLMMSIKFTFEDMKERHRLIEHGSCSV